MAFKLLDECQKKWRKLRGYEEIKNLLNGQYLDQGQIYGPIGKASLMNECAQKGFNVQCIGD